MTLAAENIDIPVKVLISGQVVLLGDLQGDLVSVDSAASALVVIDIEHHLVHEGNAFSINSYNADVDEASCAVFTINVPVSGAYHFTFSVTADAAGWVEFREAVINSGDGSAITEYNVNRATRTSSLVNFTVGGNFLSGAGGTTLWTGILGANNNKTKIGGESRNGYEWILTSGKCNVIFFPAANSTAVVFNADFYEVA